jgi:hypothetical protein
MEAGLRDNPHYRHAVAVGQLAPLELTLLDSRGSSAWSIYERRRLGLGQKAGDIKPALLDAWTGWSREFQELIRSPVGERPAI